MRNAKPIEKKVTFSQKRQLSKRTQNSHENTTLIGWMCSKSVIKTPEWRQISLFLKWGRTAAFIVDLEYIQPINIFSLFTWNMYLSAAKDSVKTNVWVKLPQNVFPVKLFPRRHKLVNIVQDNIRTTCEICSKLSKKDTRTRSLTWFWCPCC